MSFALYGGSRAQPMCRTVDCTSYISSRETHRGTFIRQSNYPSAQGYNKGHQTSEQFLNMSIVHRQEDKGLLKFIFKNQRDCV